MADKRVPGWPGYWISDEGVLTGPKGVVKWMTAPSGVFLFRSPDQVAGAIVGRVTV